MLYRVALVRTDVSEDLSVSFFRVTRIGELGTRIAVTSNRRTLRRNAKALSSSETSILTRATRRNIPEDGILHSHQNPQILHRFGVDYIALDHVLITSERVVITLECVVITLEHLLMTLECVFILPEKPKEDIHLLSLSLETNCEANICSTHSEPNWTAEWMAAKFSWQ
jgi:hypothetical protein